MLRDSTLRFVGRSVSLSVGWSVTFHFFYEFYFLTSLLLPKWSRDLKYGPCPPARDWGSRVSGLVCFLSSSLSFRASFSLTLNNFVFSRAQVRGRGVIGREPVLSKWQPAFQYSSHVSLQSPSGHMWGTFKMEREDGFTFDCRIPPFSLESKPGSGESEHGAQYLTIESAMLE